MTATSTEVSLPGVTTVRASGREIVRRGLALSPAIKDGLGLTLLLAVLSTVGGSVVPVVIQRTVDSGLGDGGETTLSAIGPYLLGALVLVLLTAVVAYWMRVRLFVASERGLAELRVTAFRHVHDLSMLTQNAERRGVLVSRVTSDIDQVSLFLQFTGIMIVISLGQMLVATVIMAFYSWQLTLVVWLCFLPLAASLKYFAARLSRAYDTVRRTVGEMLAVVAEPVVGASVVKAHAIEDRTQARVDAGIQRNLDANVRAQKLVAVTFASAGLVGGLANAGAVAVGVVLGVAGGLSMGTVIAFAFLVGLLVGPAQMATQVLTEAQNAIASWRRVIELLDTPADVVDPGPDGVGLPDEVLGARFEHVAFAYPDGPEVLSDVDVTIQPRQRVAVVGETGSGKTTFAKLLTRLMDPVRGTVRLGDTDIARVSFDELRRHVLMVPQEGFLFDATLRENLLYGRDDATDVELVAAVDDLGLTDWFAGLPHGLDTRVGQRGESLSAGERQLVALVRSALADPDFLVLDEATSAVDPQTELRATRALETLLEGRTSVTIAHRLSTAENADRVLVFDAGRLVEDGSHDELVDAGGVYARLHASWVAQASLGIVPAAE
ncbi:MULTISPECIES: ABC transporter ATP-binding protein [unclassified Aeromicrobium]|uniref:ABC transporter ATP-binding protein n=1 Tax=unclassified Aeromicrobium TaxID=2633570 RepID=UPI00070076C0|nr:MULTISPECIES: ABC transporter ATP-binding protein [unclassified Aeromicrobium]RYY48753.1 MAG: ABC transporter ATP-binding protein [Actinomycetales bacterium]KQO37470.1 multidrug ABC transporter ATP-binding protein [Aeromicrobium sp. Leaf245]KQP26329.1 multidrug ABC transporter ATP-binding protein [Aeromicrobium sp. Leaf272]KQP75998.1 multidrug ABC transporter ATP-binding protein [Aeromicrobium sp. Leaf289]KQP85026.1 multidrug ABC transporter ATP-binding protein [Aeromicrobium sp. Leaf291]